MDFRAKLVSLWGYCSFLNWIFCPEQSGPVFNPVHLKAVSIPGVCLRCGYGYRYSTTSTSRSRTNSCYRYRRTRTRLIRWPRFSRSFFFMILLVHVLSFFYALHWFEVRHFQSGVDVSFTRLWRSWRSPFKLVDNWTYLLKLLEGFVFP